VLPQLLLEQREGELGVLRIAAVHDLVVRHRDDRRQDLAFGDQVVGDEPGAAFDVPVRRQLTAAAEEIEDRVPARAVVARRCVDVHLPFAVQHVRVIDVPSHRAMRHRLRVVVRRSIAMNHDRAVPGLV
jgi:hypothetical protein